MASSAILLEPHVVYIYTNVNHLGQKKLQFHLVNLMRIGVIPYTDIMFVYVAMPNPRHFGLFFCQNRGSLPNTPKPSQRSHGVVYDH